MILPPTPADASVRAKSPRGVFQGSPPGRACPASAGGWGWVKTGTDYNRVVLQQDELGEAKSAPAEDTGFIVFPFVILCVNLRVPLWLSDLIF